MTEQEIVNRVASSPIITFDLAEYYHAGERLVFDLAPYLYQGLILREKDFRTFVKDHDWSVYQDKNVALTCTEEAIIPTWAYMLVTTRLEPFANNVVFGGLDLLEYSLFKEALGKVDPVEFENKPVVVKGCGDIPVPASAYVEITRLIRPYAKSIMYGEPCSTVPLYKKPRQPKN